MTITASQKYVRCSTQKLKFVVDSVKHMDLLSMKAQLSYMNKEASRRLLQTLNQALGNASHNYGLSPDQLELESLIVLRGPQFKRMRAVSRGQGHAILKRTSHIVLKLKSKAGADVKEMPAATSPVSAEPQTQEEVEPKKTAVKKTTTKKAVQKKEDK
jgi:large subunit ribosomal protein L22